MSTSIIVQGHSLEQIVYKGLPVVTYEQIALVHGIPVRNVHRTFERHQKEFVSGEDYFRLDFAEASQLPLRVEANPNGLTLFTEGGYLLLVKPMRDKVSWQVYRQMRAAYFREQAGQQAASADTSIAKLADLVGNAVQFFTDQLFKTSEHVKFLAGNQAQLQENQAQLRENQAQLQENQAQLLEKYTQLEGKVEAWRLSSPLAPEGWHTTLDWLETSGTRKDVGWIPQQMLDVFKSWCRAMHPRAPKYRVPGREYPIEHWPLAVLVEAWERTNKQISLFDYKKHHRPRP